MTTKPVSLGLAAGEASHGQLNDRDSFYYNQWKENPTKQNMALVVNSLKPLMIKEVSKISGQLPQSALMGEAMKWTVHAVRTYDPNAGASLSTHATNWLQKSKRLNYEYQNAARLPEALQLQFGKFNDTVNNFREQHDREPTDDELAKHLGWSKKQVINLKGRLYSDLTEGAQENPSLASKANEESLFIEHLKVALDPVEREMLFNPDGLSVGDLAKKLNLPMARYQYLRTKLVKKIEGMKNDFHR